MRVKNHPYMLVLAFDLFSSLLGSPLGWRWPGEPPELPYRKHSCKLRRRKPHCLLLLCRSHPDSVQAEASPSMDDSFWPSLFSHVPAAVAKAQESGDSLFPKRGRVESQIIRTSGSRAGQHFFPVHWTNESDPARTRLRCIQASCSDFETRPAWCPLLQR